MAQAKKEYILFVKKSYVLQEMADSKNDKKWVLSNIKNRYVSPQRPLYGLVT